VHALNAYEIGLHQKPYPKRCWLQQGKQSADGVVGGNAVSKRQKALQPGGFTVTVGLISTQLPAPQMTLQMVRAMISRSRYSYPDVLLIQ
jgi:hypothetical protein